jgi:hypothetical protein
LEAIMVEKKAAKPKSRSTTKKAPASPRTAAEVSTGTHHASRTRPDGPSEISAEERRKLIAEAAYYRAERRGFRCRCSEQDWFDAEAEVERALAEGAKASSRPA